MVRPAFGSCQLTTTSQWQQESQISQNNRQVPQAVSYGQGLYLNYKNVNWVIIYIFIDKMDLAEMTANMSLQKYVSKVIMLKVLVFKIKLRLIQNKCFVCNIATETFHCSVNGKVQKKREDYIDWREYFMAMAFLAAKRSKDPSSQVGACVVNKENKIVGIG